MDALRGSYACISDRVSTIVAGNEKLFFSQISHFMISDRIIMSDYPFSFQPKPRLWGYATVCRAHNNGIQHVNMSVEHGAHHFTWFLDVLRAFVSVSERF